MSRRASTRPARRRSLGRLRRRARAPRPRRGRRRSRRGRESASASRASLDGGLATHQSRRAGRPSGVSPSRTTSKPWLLVEGEVRLVVRQQRARERRRARRRRARAASSAVPMPLPPRAGLDADPGEVPVRLGHGRRRASPRPPGRRRGSATSPRATPERRRDERAQHRRRRGSCGRPGGSQRAQPRDRPGVVQTSASVTSKPTRKSHGRSAARRSRARQHPAPRPGRPGTRARAPRSPRRAAGRSRTISTRRP